jgi:hypothetical protein
MTDDLLGIGGLLGCIVLLVLYALAIGAKTKKQPSKPFKPIKTPTRNIKTPKITVTSLAYQRIRREVMARAAEGPKPPERPDFSTRKTDPDFGRKYREWWYHYE